MTPEEIRESLKKHMDDTHRKVSKEDYLALRHVNEYTEALKSLVDKKITLNEFEENFEGSEGSYRIMNKEEIEELEWPKTIAPIMKYEFGKVDTEQIQIV